MKGASQLTHMNVGGYGLTASLEGGYPIHIAQNWTITPQAQAVYQHVHLDSGVDAFGDTGFGATDDVRGRIGAMLSHNGVHGEGKDALPITYWARLNLWHDFMANAPSATFASLSGTNPVTLKGSLGGTWGEIDAGVTAQVTKNVSLFASAVYDQSIDSGKSWSVGGRAGVKLIW